jgi:hypothetical protein
MRKGADVFCVECWRRKADAGERPTRILDSESSEEPDDNFWLVDSCASCGGEVKYKTIRLLD